MDRLRKSLRSSIRKKKHRDEPEDATAQPKSSTGSGKPQLWSNDEAAVRSGTCSFHVKYLGCVEVFESRGMQVCEEAIKVLKNSKRKSVRAIFYVHGDGLRVVDAETKGLIVDQTIEKVSFCAPDRNFEKGFSYICRDGTTRRWMCHGFMSNRDSGERLSHAVGCAFAICLERKQKRDKECSVTMTYDSTNSSFTRFGSFRQATITERLQDPQGFKGGAIPKTEAATPEDKQFAIARPHATDLMLQRQTSFRGFGQLGGNSPFKRNLSLRLSDLPSNLERQRANQSGGEKPAAVMPVQQLKAQLNTLYKMSENNNNTNGRVSPIPETQPTKDEDISAMCQQLSHGLSLLNAQDFQNHDSQHEQPHSLPPLSPLPPVPEHESPILQPEKTDPLANVQPVQYDNPWDFVPDQTKYSGAPQGLTKPSSNCDSSSGVSSSASTSNGGVASGQTPDWLTTNGVLDGKKSPTHSLGSASSKEWNAEFWSKDPFDTSAAILDDPFDAEWAALATRNSSRNDIQSPTNPFKESGMKAFELQM